MSASPVHAADPWYAWEVPLVGIPTRFESNAPEVITIAQDALGAWHGHRAADVGAGAPVLVRIEVTDDADPGSAGRAPLRYDVQESRIAITGPGVSALSDTVARRAHARVAAPVVADAEHFRYGILEALALSIVSYMDRQPVHAAGIARGETVLLLVGTAGVGKSTLAYAAMRAGLRVFAEDIVWLQQRPQPRVWGLARRIHLPADAGRHFPELRGTPSAIVAGGEPKIVVPVDVHQRAPLAATRSVHICLMDRPNGDTPSVEPLDRDAVRRALTPTEPGFLLFADSIGPALDHLAAPGGWRLRASTRPAAAIPLLADLLDAVAARPA